MGGASSFCKSPIQTCCGFLRKEDAVVGGGGACYGRRMNGKELFSHAIGVRPPWEVKEVRMDMKAQRVEVEVECTQTVWADPTTRQRLHLHGYEERSWRHLDTMQFETIIVAKVPRLKYPDGHRNLHLQPRSPAECRSVRAAVPRSPSASR